MEIEKFAIAISWDNRIKKMRSRANSVLSRTKPGIAIEGSIGRIEAL